MADKVDPRAGELTTSNYGWVKPTVGASVDAWGGYINTDLDGIDSTVKSVSNAIPVASSTTPAMDGTATVGTGTTFARADHIHPSDTTKYNASNPSGYQTAAQVTAAVPVASSTTPVMDGVAAIGVGTTWARADHVHPLASQVMGDNRIINGDMRIDQRNNGASGTAINSYTVDRWGYYATQASKGTWGRNTANPYSLAFTSSSAYALVAADYFIFAQSIEADQISDFQFGTAAAQPITLSFQAFSSLAGTFSGSIRNYAGARSYPFTYTLAANTWTKVAITIPGDTGGTWVMTGNAGSMIVGFDLGSGPTSRGSAGAWSSNNYTGVTGAVSVVGTNGATFYLTGVKLEIGSVATPYPRQSLAKSMADCQRYYQVLGNAVLVSGYGPSGAILYSSMPLPVVMRVAPSVVYSSVVYGSGASLTANNSTPNLLINAFTLNATAVGYAQGVVSLSAEL